ncbi:MAG TPA: hypothetical protein VJM13_01115, partial [Sphingopyxis sp.]|nr:hypothetical protein [Sphingopyxis sp.]
MTIPRSLRRLLPVLIFACALPAHATITTTVVANDVTVTSIDEVAVTLSCGGGNLNVNGALPPDAGAVPCAAITSLLVVGNALDNQLQLSAVTPIDFTSISSVQVSGGDGADTIVGSGFADTIRGEGGNDSLDGHDNPPGTTDLVLGGDGDDTMVWNPGKDDDVNVGGAGNDTSLIVGGGAAETFAIAPSPLEANVVRLERTAPAPFFVDISETELLRVQGNGGDDVMSAATLPAGLIALELLGGDGNDTLTGSDGADLLDGGLGNDLLDGDDNPVGTT